MNQRSRVGSSACEVRQENQTVPAPTSNIATPIAFPAGPLSNPLTDILNPFDFRFLQLVAIGRDGSTVRGVLSVPTINAS
jgi:hypothetical protein